MLPRLTRVLRVSLQGVARRPRAYIRVAGPDAEDYLQRMLSNDVTTGEVVDALLLTPKSRLIAPLRVWRRGPEDFLLLTERSSAKRYARSCCARASREVRDRAGRTHLTARLRRRRGPARRAPGDGGGAGCGARADAWRRRGRARPDRGRRPGLGQGARRFDPACRAGLDETHISFTKGCYPGQEPIARLHHPRAREPRPASPSHRGAAGRRAGLGREDGRARDELGVRSGACLRADRGA